MRREEKRRKFQEAILNTLYPPPSPPPQEDEQNPLLRSGEDFDLDLDFIPADDYGVRESGSPSVTNGNGDDECGTQKLTRAQRKRLRGKKLKEDVSRRGKLIGPLLPPPPTSDPAVDDSGGVGNRTSPVRQNADEKDAEASSSPHGTNHQKLKQRRIAKKLGRERLKASANLENCVPDQTLEEPPIRETCDRD